MKNLYILFGIDSSIINEEKNKIIKEINSNDIVKYSLDNTDIVEIIDDANTISMFSNKKIIIIEDCNFLAAAKSLNNQEQLESYIENYNPNTYILFIANIEKIDTRKKIYKKVVKEGQIIECNNNNDTYINNYINNYAKENNYKINNIKYFIEIVGKNLNNIKNELDKLFMLKIETKIIEDEDIDKICIKNMDEEIFSLTDAIIANNKEKSLNLLKEFLNNNYEEIAIIALLATQFRFLYQVKKLYNKDKNYEEIAKILEVNPYRVKFTINKIHDYTEKELEEKIKKLAQIDYKIKTGLIDKKNALELFILN